MTPDAMILCAAVSALVCMLFYARLLRIYKCGYREAWVRDGRPTWFWGPFFRWLSGTPDWALASPLVRAQFILVRLLSLTVLGLLLGALCLYLAD